MQSEPFRVNTASHQSAPSPTGPGHAGSQQGLEGGGAQGSQTASRVEEGKGGYGATARPAAHPQGHRQTASQATLQGPSRYWGASRHGLRPRQKRGVERSGQRREGDEGVEGGDEEAGDALLTPGASLM